MKKLPFKVQPKQQTILVGNDTTGVLEIPTIGGLKVGEQVIVDEVAQNMPNAFALASRLAVKIDSELELNDLLFAFDVVASPNWEFDQRDEIESLQGEGKITAKEAQKRTAELDSKVQIFRQARIRYAPDILDLNSSTEQAGRSKQIAAVTAVLTRVDDSWTKEDTNDLSDSLFQEIWKFVQKEMGQEDSPVSELTEEDVGKQPEEEPQAESTGQISSGESNTSGEEMNGLAPKTLELSPVG